MYINQHPHANTQPPTTKNEEREIRHSLILHINHPLRMRVPEITVMRRTRVDLRLVERVCDFIGEDAGGETGN